MTTLVLRVVPGARRWAVERGGPADGADWKLRIDAPAVEGAANARAIELLAKEVLGIARSRVVLVRGEKSRIKAFDVDLPLADATARLERAAAESSRGKLAG